MESKRSRQAITALHSFVATPLETVLNLHTEHAPDQAALALFHSVAATVPAYRAFLAEQGLEANAIQTVEDFKSVPSTTKQNYQSRYPLADLCRDGELASCDFIAVSSGSTGQPTFWPRFLSDELSIVTRFEQIFHDSFEAELRRTLAVVCFTLGTWVGGMFTANCCRYLSSKDYPITVITPGNNKEEIYRVVTELGPAFEQVVLLGYPPFLKDIVDGGIARGIDWRPYRLKFVMAGEVFSEEWRTLVGERVGSDRPCYNSASLYGTADAGVLANETPLSICIRRFLAGNPAAARALFGESRLPTLAQYDPLSRFFEQDGQSLLFSGENGIPLRALQYARYRRHYHIRADAGISRAVGLRSTRRAGTTRPAWHAPAAVCVCIWPFEFHCLVLRRKHLPRKRNRWAGTAGDQRMGHWQIRAGSAGRCRPQPLSFRGDRAGTERGRRRRQAAGDRQSILAQLRRLNSEFANYVPAEYQLPRVRLAPLGDPDYFPLGVKHRYTRKPAE